MAISKEDVLEFISGLSVLELSELVKEFEEKIFTAPFFVIIVVYLALTVITLLII